MACTAPQTRAYWAKTLGAYDEDYLREALERSEEGLTKHGKTTRRCHHDWTIYRNCVIREMRRRGLTP